MRLISGHQELSCFFSFNSVLYFRYTFLIGKPPYETSDVKKTYKRIRVNDYSFPEHVKISENARKLIKGILVLDPDKRFTFAEIMNHPFFTTEGTIPATLPISTLALPPSVDFIKKHKEGKIVQEK